MRINGREATYHKLVFEVRYEQGFVYLDRCGSMINRIMTSYPEWILKSDNVMPQGAPMVNPASGVQFTFGPQKYDFSLDQPIAKETALTLADIKVFVDEAEGLSEIVHEELGL